MTARGAGRHRQCACAHTYEARTHILRNCNQYGYNLCIVFFFQKNQCKGVSILKDLLIHSCIEAKRGPERGSLSFLNSFLGQMDYFASKGKFINMYVL